MGSVAQQQSKAAHVRSRSEADISQRPINVRFTPKSHSPSVIIVHGHGEFHRIVKRGRGPHDRAASLQVLPAQRTIDTVEDKNHAAFGSFDPHFYEALEERRVIKIEQAR